ncbi:hypothetical protein OG21DRAFT_1528149 [Imleria badia]|nr:hypothetical protein OG21DRAFT_1528149 [Imleria badia]
MVCPPYFDPPVSNTQLQQGEDKFKHGLTSMSNNAITKAYVARLAFKKCILARISVTQAEIDALEKQWDFIQSLDNEAHSDLAVIDTQLSLFRELMDEKGIADNIAYYHAVYKDNLLALATADVGLHQMTSDRAFPTNEGNPVHFDMGVSDEGDSPLSEGDVDASASSAEASEDE